MFYVQEDCEEKRSDFIKSGHWAIDWDKQRLRLLFGPVDRQSVRSGRHEIPSSVSKVSGSRLDHQRNHNNIQPIQRQKSNFSRNEAKPASKLPEL